MIYLGNGMYSNSGPFLCHHGIKGQEWGVRRGPPYPIEDTVMNKGHRVNSVQFAKGLLGKKQVIKNVKNNDRWLYTYNPEDKWDSAIYKGPFSLYKSRYMKSGDVYDTEFEVLKDLKMPTKKQRVDEFIKLYKQKNKSYTKEMIEMQDMMVDYGVGDIKTRTAKIGNPNKLSASDIKAAYEVFNHLMEHAEEWEFTKDYQKIMSSKYDAMVDDNNQGIYNDSHDPVIIFDKDNVKLNKVSKVSKSAVNKNFSYVKDELKKKGRVPML